MGRGYARHSRVQLRAGDYGMPLPHRALDAVVPPEPGAPFRVADLGAAAGTNSLDPMRAVVAGLRGRTGEDRATGDVQDYADGVTGFFRAAFAPSLVAGLPAGRARAVSQAFTDGLRARVAADPEAVETHWHVVPLRLARR